MGLLEWELQKWTDTSDAIAKSLAEMQGRAAAASAQSDEAIEIAAEGRITILRQELVSPEAQVAQHIE